MEALSSSTNTIFKVEIFISTILVIIITNISNIVISFHAKPEAHNITNKSSCLLRFNILISVISFITVIAHHEH